MSGTVLRLRRRRQRLERDDALRNVWRREEETRDIDAAHVGVIICDMWDAHWSGGAALRVTGMAPRMNQVVKRARDLGAHIIHAPSDTMDFYAGTPARDRIAGLSVDGDAPPPKAIEAPPLPIDDADHGSDTNDGSEDHMNWCWTRQIDVIEIDQGRDGISDSGDEIRAYASRRGIEQLVIMGVHTNMCILGRSFGIREMVKRGYDIALCRDLTDAMYNPERSPYVSHERGTELVVEYIEKFWCPTVSSDDLLG